MSLEETMLTTIKQLYNLSDELFDASIFGFVPLAYTEPEADVADQIWSPEDVVIVSGSWQSGSRLYSNKSLAYRRTLRLGMRHVR
jgi:hypothetical protein